ncbi:MAG TPA: hypothetical protein EYP90_08560 [Chromatiaceae bacterium]|nr:hypothetical protein [Chromatiaceae bacterium]
MNRATLLVMTGILLSNFSWSSPGEQGPLPALRAAGDRPAVLFELPIWETTVEQIEASTEIAMAAGDQRLNAIAALKPHQLTLSNTLAALDDAFYPVVATLGRLSIIDASHPDKPMREAAHQAKLKLQKWMVDASFRDDVYRNIKAFAATDPKLQGEDAMLLKTVMRDYRRNGMDLPQAQRERLQSLKNRLNELGQEFALNIKQADVFVEFTRDELKGLSEDFLGNDEIQGENGKYLVNANVSWQVVEVLRNAENEETRRKLTLARMNRARKENIPIFTEILKTRARIAALLGYNNWADYRIEPKMARNALVAQRFLKDLAKGLDPKFKAELATFRKLKAEHTGNPDAVLRYWDIGYYKNQLKKTRYQIDSNALKVYFELERTLKGMFGIFEELFGIHIESVTAPYKWVPDLRLYAVSDSATGAPLGYIYMDMFPREGKYNHFAQFGITPGKLLADGRYQRPVVALICNFPPPSNGKPSLLTFNDVETLFHEFGHALHSVMTQASYLEFSGTSVPRDFVEAPSQMLENWVRDKKILDRFAVDYRDGKSRIPGQILDQMEAARLATIGTFYRSQIGYGLLDLALHMTTDEEILKRPVELSNRIMSETYLKVPEKTALIAAFGHLGGGYDAGYYGYAWADAIAADMVSVFRESPGGLMDKPTGMRLRKEIYEVGGSREIEDSIRAFLGRERSLRPFFEYIGLKNGQ